MDRYKSIDKTGQGEYLAVLFYLEIMRNAQDESGGKWMKRSRSTWMASLDNIPNERNKITQVLLR